MATQLQLVKKVENRNAVSTLEVADVFTTAYDVYMVSISKFEHAGNPDYMTIRMRNSSGLDTGSNYMHAGLQMPSHQTFYEARSTGTTHIQNLNYTGTTFTNGAGHIIYFYNPADSSSYTFFKNESSSYSTPQNNANYAFKNIAVHKVAEAINGFGLLRTGSFTNVDISVYGVK